MQITSDLGGGGAKWGKEEGRKEEGGKGGYVIVLGGCVDGCVCMYM